MLRKYTPLAGQALDNFLMCPHMFFDDAKLLSAFKPTRCYRFGVLTLYSDSEGSNYLKLSQPDLFHGCLCRGKEKPKKVERFLSVSRDYVEGHSASYKLTVPGRYVYIKGY